MIFSKNEAKQKSKSPVSATKESINQLIKQGSTSSPRDTLVIDLMDEVLLFAHTQRSSDIHFEQWKENSLIRFRVDGILLDQFTLPNYLHEQLVARLKIMTQMRTDEHRVPQDGRLTFSTPDSTVDVRASIIATAYGEKIVLRILADSTRGLSLEQLGFSKDDLTNIQAAINKPWGMILATGPTGSGKTTSIYAVLQQLNTRDVNISTIEYPIESKINGVNQSQVDPPANFVFATGLRALLRQDPDIMMVGEIRDTETAKIAVNAAMTGHKLLSTLHTNDAATTIPRLIDMGIEPFLISSTLNCAIAQRLMRRVCDNCSQKETIKIDRARKILPDDIIKMLFGTNSSITLSKAVGCDKCINTGYKGRVGLFEVLSNSPAIQKLIIGRAESATIKTQAQAEGMRTIEYDGILKLKAGLSTLAEYIRVLHE